MENMSNIVEYAFERGVIVIPEFDMPAHASSWGAGKPNIVVTESLGCSPTLFTHGDTLDPTKNETFDLIRTFLKEMGGIFKTPFLHLGGDEVPSVCWLNSDHVVSWMKDRGYNSTSELENYFVNRVANEYYNDSSTSSKILMYWEVRIFLFRFHTIKSLSPYIHITRRYLTMVVSCERMRSSKRGNRMSCPMS